MGEIQLWIKVQISTRKAIKYKNISDGTVLLGLEVFRVWLFVFKIGGLEILWAVKTDIEQENSFATFRSQPL